MGFEWGLIFISGPQQVYTYVFVVASNKSDVAVIFIFLWKSNIKVDPKNTTTRIYVEQKQWKKEILQGPLKQIY